MTVALSVVSVLLLGVFTGSQLRAVRHMEDQNSALRLLIDVLARTDDPLGEALRTRLDEVERVVEALPTKWEVIKRNAENAEARARYHAKRALDELEEHGLTTPGMEAIGSELFADHGETSNGSGMQPVPAPVESSPALDDYLSLARERKYGA